MTVMTVGYGDIVPISVGGRVVACATMLAGGRLGALGGFELGKVKRAAFKLWVSRSGGLMA